MLADDDDVVQDIMDTHVISANTLEDQESVAQMFTKYDFSALPVVDKENRLVGIVTVDDAMDVLEEEVTEDIEKMAAMAASDEPLSAHGGFGNLEIPVSLAADPDALRHLDQHGAHQL